MMVLAVTFNLKNANHCRCTKARVLNIFTFHQALNFKGKGNKNFG